MTRKKLPIGIQTFREIREDNCYYVDKTGYALKMATEGKSFFLSRPRRFGKSLFLDTLGELFAGSEALFQGLHVHDKWDWSRQAPVVRISFAEGTLHSRATLDERIWGILKENRETLGLSLTSSPGIPTAFSELLREAHAATGERVVVLVDEYDKPILDNIDDPLTAAVMRDGLRNFYSVIKGADAHIRFTMITGVSKFSKVSLFSGLNHLNDITLDAKYSAVCGYTDADVDTVFAPELTGLDRNEIRHWYNGYNWTGTPVYNPFDVLLLLDKRKFKAYWFETGTPDFLVNLLASRQTWVPELGRLETDSDILSTFEVDNITTEALMFQAGYLTIESVERKFGEYWYKLRYPNHEVYQSLHNSLLKTWSPAHSPTVRNKLHLGELLTVNDFAGMHVLFTSFFASIPHDWYRNNPIAQYEGYYASVFYAYFAALGLDITLEDATNHGRLDMAIKFSEQVYLFEFKVVEFQPNGSAMQQLKDRAYADKYKALRQPIHLIGVEFSKDARSVVGFEVETLVP
jgi:hypothetical protein